jgi:hypothetical protein
MARTKLFRTGTLGLALTAYDVWRRLPPRHRRLIIAQTRQHGPRVARMVVARTRRVR